MKKEKTKTNLQKALEKLNYSANSLWIEAVPVTWGEPWAPQLTSHQMMRLGRERILYYLWGEHHSAMNMVTALCWYPDHWTRAAAHKIACHHTHSTTCSQNSSGTSVSLSWAKCFSSCTILSSRKTQQLQSIPAPFAFSQHAATSCAEQQREITRDLITHLAHQPPAVPVPG